MAITTLLASLAVSGFTSAVPAAPSPVAHAAATCADYSDQAAAQQAADTRDADGDGIYCESLPCPCSNAAGGATKPAPANPTPTTSCTKPSSVQNITFSSTKYPTIRQHFLKALRKGWPRILVVNRPGADARRTRLLEDVPTRAGQDRDEYPPAVARGKGFHIRGINPRGWMADVAYVPSSENRSHGSTMGTKLRRFCNGTKFRYVFY